MSELTKELPALANPELSADVHTKSPARDGGYCAFCTQSVPVPATSTPRRGRTKHGDGIAEPTPYVVLWHGRWMRVKCFGRETLYIGAKYDPCLTVQIG